MLFNKKQEKEFDYLDKTLPREGDFYYIKNETTESAARPVPLTFGLLKKIYSDDGPVKKVFEKEGVEYNPQKFLHIIGNELYVDQEKENKTLFPEKTSGDSSLLEIFPANINSLLQTLKNEFILHYLKKIEINKLIKELKNRIETSARYDSLSSLLELFLKDYKLIFEINLRTQIAINNLINTTQKDPGTIAWLLKYYKSIGISLKQIKIKIDKNLMIGNSLDISDESGFNWCEDATAKTDEGVERWWSGISKSKQATIKDLVEAAAQYLELKEISRWLLVKNISLIRKEAISTARRIGFKHKRNIYYATMNELLSRHIYEKVCVERYENYHKFDEYNFPSVIRNEEYKESEILQGISPGEARGVLLNALDVEKKDLQNTNYILYCTSLDLSLCKHLSSIKGIITEKGKIESYLAILARAKGVPIITNFNINKEKIKFGDYICINGEKGDVYKK